jgi:hypothetical protein
MRIRTLGTLTVFGVFTAFSLWVCSVEGYWGFLDVAREGRWGTQVFADLCIALWMAMSLYRKEAARIGIPFWPYMIAVPFLGSLSPLVFLLHRRWVLSRGAPAAEAATTV